jgi:hypothetical protein
VSSSGARSVVVWLLVLGHVCVCGCVLCSWGTCPLFFLLNTTIYSSSACSKKKILDMVVESDVHSPVQIKLFIINVVQWSLSPSIPEIDGCLRV